MDLRAIIFDLGNVLVFHDDALLFERFARRSGRTAEEVKALFYRNSFWEAANRGQLGAEEIHRAACQLLHTEIPAEEFAGLWSSHFTPNAPMLNWVEKLAPRVRLAVLSNTNLLHLQYLKTHCPLLKKFQVALYSCELGMTKPDPAIFQVALSKLQTEAHETAFFDDIPAYVEAARRLGLEGRVFTTVSGFTHQMTEFGFRLGGV